MTLIEALIINLSAWLKIAGHIIIIFYNGCTEALSILHSLHWLLDWRFIYPSKPIATFFLTYYSQHCNGCTEALIINLSGCLIEETVAGHIIFYNYWQFDLFQFTYTCEVSLICPSIWFGSHHLPSEKASNLKPIICILFHPFLNNPLYEQNWIKFPAPIQDLRKCCHSSDSKIVRTLMSNTAACRNVQSGW